VFIIVFGFVVALDLPQVDPTLVLFQCALYAIKIIDEALSRGLLVASSYDMNEVPVPLIQDEPQLTNKLWVELNVCLSLL